MIEVKTDLWDMHDQGKWICITTNGVVKQNCCAVMGRGCAKEARDKFPGLDRRLGQSILEFGNIPFILEMERIITFPVKHNWWESADIELIIKSAVKIREAWTDKYIRNGKLYIPRPGCGNGNLKWSYVGPKLETVFDNDNFVIVSK